MDFVYFVRSSVMAGIAIQLDNNLFYLTSILSYTTRVFRSNFAKVGHQYENRIKMHRIFNLMMYNTKNVIED